MPEEIHLRVQIPKNRNLTGWLYVQVDGVTVNRMRVLARGSRGPGDTQFLEDGNTPTGTYDGSTFSPTYNWPQKSYGPWGAIRLKPIAGNAVAAESVFGRNGLLIHGGTLGGKGYWRGEGKLRATNGCLRVSNEDMLELREILFHDEKEQVCRANPPRVRVTVQE